jgi:hypothetical protein
MLIDVLWAIIALITGIFALVKSKGMAKKILIGIYSVLSLVLLVIYLKLTLG